MRQDAARMPVAFGLALYTAMVSAAEPFLPQPTSFETLVGRPNTAVIGYSRIGHVLSADAQVTVGVLVVEDAGDPSSRMAGVRFDLQNNAGMDEVYIEQGELDALMKDLVEIQGAIPELGRTSYDTVWREQGTESCWMRRPPTRVLCPSYRMGPDGSALGLGAYGGPHFYFPNREPSDLIELTEQAMAQLDAHEPKTVH